MCGIVGQYNYSPLSISLDFWNKMVDLMFRRGPDDRGIWTDSKTCVIGCRRLSIIDPGVKANLPIKSADGKYILGYNGELYNFLELRHELKLRGYTFRTASDSEVVLNALIEWKEAAFDKFNGMFALAFYDINNKQLLLGRDHAGIKPLYYLVDQKGIIFASQYDQIIAHPWARGLPYSKEAVEMYMRLGYIPAPFGLLKNTHMLPPGTWMKVDCNGKQETHRYYSFTQTSTIDKNLSNQDLLELTTVILANSVKRQMISDVPIGSFLSGGIDSPLISALMARELPKKLPTFSIGLENESLDESREILNYAKHLKNKLYMQKLRSKDAESLFEEVLDSTKEPLADEGIFPSLVVSKLARRYVKVALSGEGGDELFWGYYPRQQAILQNNSNRHESLGHKYFSFFSPFSREQFTQCFIDTEWWPKEHKFYNFNTNNPEEIAKNMRQNEFEMYLPFILLKTDRSSMHHSLEVRVPFLDREVIDLASQLSHVSCIDLQEGVGKLPLRRTLQKFIPWQTKIKKGFTMPINEWLRKPLRPFMEESLKSLRGLEILNINQHGIKNLFQRHIEGIEDNGMALWQILLLDHWVKKYLV